METKFNKKAILRLKAAALSAYWQADAQDLLRTEFVSKANYKAFNIYNADRTTDPIPAMIPGFRGECIHFVSNINPVCLHNPTTCYFDVRATKGQTD